jgi:hypothetical protein
MTREKIYASDAHRQQAYRQRLKDRLAGLLPVVGKSKPKRVTRPKRLESVIKELEDLIQEYENWLEALPENLSESEQASQLQDSIEQLQEAASILDAIDLPRGFGR